jgi:hypothetical protein
MIISAPSDAILPLTADLAQCLNQHFPTLLIYIGNDIPGEDHVYAQYHGHPAFDLLVTTARRFVFLWYYALPSRVAKDKGTTMVDAMRTIAVDRDFDLVVKYAWAQVKPGAPALIIRQNKQARGQSIFVHPRFQEFIVKAGNPQLDEAHHSELFLATYRNYRWNFNGALPRIRAKALAMMTDSLARTHKLHHRSSIRGVVLYAGCAFHYCYPRLGFGMRDVDVNIFLSEHSGKHGMRSARAAFSRHCDIKEFGMPEYFGYHTRLLDLMWNVFHTDHPHFATDVVAYLNEMRFTSDRWATISQRPLVDLTTRQPLYIPAWVQKFASAFPHLVGQRSSQRKA